MQRLTIMLALVVLASGCTQLTPLQHWCIAGESLVVTDTILLDLYAAGELDDDDMLKVAEYSDIATQALLEWYESIVEGESFTQATIRFNRVMHELLIMQRKEQL